MKNERRAGTEGHGGSKDEREGSSPLEKRCSTLAFIWCVLLVVENFVLELFLSRTR